VLCELLEVRDVPDSDIMGAKLQAAPLASKTTGSPSKETAAERRQVPVMLSDLVGSTALSARMDPANLRKIISA
jgi:hypothetical protein